MASKTKIYIVLEYVTGGELFDKIVSSSYISNTWPTSVVTIVIYNVGQCHVPPCPGFYSLLQAHSFYHLRNQVHQGRLKEDESRKYFQQLIDAVDYCHSRRVYHRDLKVHIRDIWEEQLCFWVVVKQLSRASCKDEQGDSLFSRHVASTDHVLGGCETAWEFVVGWERQFENFWLWTECTTPAVQGKHYVDWNMSFLVYIWVLCKDYWFYHQWRALPVILVKSDPCCLVLRRMGCYIRHVEHLIMLPRRSSTTKAIMEQQQICGHVVWSCSYWWLATCRLMNPISWPYTRR